jgi:predicted RNase H-like nuclease (RuvC/YqgF family)
MSYFTEIATGSGAAAAAVAAWRFLKSPVGGRFIAAVTRTFKRETESLREAVENLAAVVTAQGESIEWLRGELDRTRGELGEARAALANRENRLEAENEKLRKRVAELENQVKALESALALKSQPRRRKNV